MPHPRKPFHYGGRHPPTTKNVVLPNADRQHVAGSPSLGEELLCTFHDSDDPAPLTELLRLFSAVALTTTTVNANDGNSAAVVAAAQGNDDEEPRGSEESMTPARAGGVVKAAPEAAVAGPVGLTLRLAEKETLERLAFFLENSLEERLLAWVRVGLYPSWICAWRVTTLRGLDCRRSMFDKQPCYWFSSRRSDFLL